MNILVVRKKVSPFILFMISLFLLLIGIYWLALFIFFFVVLYFLFKSKHPFFIAFRKNVWLRGITTIIFVFVLAIGMRVFILDIYNIPSSSMEGNLLIGDEILVSKLHYGPKMPNSPFKIPWVNLFMYMNKEARAAIDSTWWKYNRLNGFSKIKKNDIIVFNHPDDNNYFYVKRCVGLPGENLEIINGMVFTDSIKNAGATTIKHSYQIWHNSIEQLNKSLKKNNIKEDAILNNLGKTQNRLLLTQQEYKSLKKSNLIDSLKVMDYPVKIQNNTSQNGSIIMHTNNWGPMEVPKNGKTVVFTENNYILYGKIMKKYEDVELLKKGEYYFVDGIKSKTYTFKQNYYFMLGDNRHNSVDSRYWGFVPEENILGKAIMVLYSSNNWKRLLKPIN